MQNPVSNLSGHSNRHVGTAHRFLLNNCLAAPYGIRPKKKIVLFPISASFWKRVSRWEKFFLFNFL